MDNNLMINVREGMDVFGSDGEKLGSIDRMEGDYLVASQGFFFPTDYYIPTSAISTVDGDQVHLNVTKDAALNQGWDSTPTTTSTTDSVVYDDTATTMTGTQDTFVADEVTVSQPVVEEVATQQPVVQQTVTDTDTIRVPLVEEDLSATKRTVDRGAVQIEKDVVVEEQTLEVPVTEERVHIERHAVNRDASGDANAFEEGTIEVPIRGEEVELRKSVRVGEEVEISKDAVQHTEQVGGTVRREEVRIDETDNRGTGNTRNQS